jgi:ABC-type multidrug transport system fused ATPase/permease subunit
MPLTARRYIVLEDFKRIIHLVKPYWHRVALAGIISVIVSGLNASLAWLVKPMMTSLSKNTAMANIYLSLKGCLFFHEYLMKSAAQKIVMNLRSSLYAP